MPTNNKPVRKTNKYRKKFILRKSERLLNQGSRSRFLEVDGGLLHIKVHCGKQSLYNINKKDVMCHHEDNYDDDVDDADDNDDDVEDDDDDDDDDDLTDDSDNKKGYDDKDWVPKSQRQNHIDSYNDAHNNTYISNCHAYHDGFFTPRFDELCYFLSNNDYATYNNDDVDYGKNINNAGYLNTLTYVRRKRKSLQRGSSRSCRRISCLWRKVHAFPSWIDKKRRVFRRKGHTVDKWATAIQLEKDSCNVHAYSKLFKAVEGSEVAMSSAVSQAREGSQSLSTLLLPPQPSSPPVFLTTVLEGLSKEPAGSEATEGSHEVQSAYISSSPTTNDTLPHQMEKLGVDKEKTDVPEELTQKFKRKKHRPKVLRDTFDKAKGRPKSREKQLAELGKDGVLKDKQTKVPRKSCAKKEKGSGESAIKMKERLSLKKGTTLVANNGIILKDSNRSTVSLCCSIVPFQSNDWTCLPDSSKEKPTLRNSTVKEVSYVQGLLIPALYSREKLCKDRSIATDVAENQVRLSPELANYMQGYRMAFQSQQQQSVPSLAANNWPLSSKFIKEASAFSLIQSKPEGSTELLLTQEPSNQLELVAYDQRREMITSKSTRLPSKIRAKVQLDIENERIWPLLALGGIPEKFDDVLYWERERALMERRVQIFICTMKSVQGDRRFSPWKGSILDSLVGAFLTQNVSDHLSSSAFMSIASRYPFKQENDSARTDKFKDTFETNGVLNADSTYSSDIRRFPCVVQSDTQDENEENLNIQGDFHLSNISNQEGTPLTCGMPVKCMKISKNFTSLRAVKKDLRNTTTSHDNNIQFRATSVTPIKTLGEEDSPLEDGTDINWVSLSLTEENLSVKQDVIDSPCLPEHKKLIASMPMQSGMQQKQGFTSRLLEAKTSTGDSNISFSRLNHHNTYTVSQTRQNGVQYLEKTFPCSTQEHIPGVTDSTRVSMQHPERVSLCSMEEVNRNVSTSGPTYNGDMIYGLDLYESGANHRKEGTLCSTLSPSTTRELLAGNNLSNAFMKENPSPKQLTPEKILERWTEVHDNRTVCRNLFKDDILEQTNSKATTALHCNDKQQTMFTFDTNLHTDVHPYDIQKSKEVHCESDVVYKTDTSPVSKIVGNKRHHFLSGVERAHLEENHNGRKKNHTQDWEALRKFTLQSCRGCESTSEENSKEDAYQDSVDWDAVRCACVEELAATIKERGMHYVLSGRIKAFLKTLHEEQGNLDLEWLRKVSPENAKAYLTAIRGLGVKSVECIRLLTFHHVAFPVDVNVARIFVRLGWVPIEPLPERLELHLLEQYPVQETIQKYLWPRLCSLDQETLYELHYQMITFGKVFCTKSKPNCNACPMRTECKHFASAYASAKLLLTGSNDESLKRLGTSTQAHVLTNSSLHTEEEAMGEGVSVKTTSYPQISEVHCDPADSCLTFDHYYIEEPASPETTHDSDISDIEEFPCIYGSLNDFTEDLLGVCSETPPKSMDGTYEGDSEKSDIQSCSTNARDESSCHNNTEEEQFNSKEAFSETVTEPCSGYQSDIFSNEKALLNESKVCQDTFVVSEAAENAIVSLPRAYIPAPKLKNVDRLRTIHYVYELPDTHPLLEQADVREKDDPSLHLLAIWSPGEAPSSLQGLDEDDLCKFSVANPNEVVKGTLLIPCRTAMRGKFPLNGTYFQVNEVFADHASSLRPLQVPRSYIWSLQRRFVYFGTSVSSIFRGLTLDEIKSCFLRGHVCVRGFDREKRAPRPLVCRLHFPISKQIQRPKKHDQEAFST